VASDVTNGTVLCLASLALIAVGWYEAAHHVRFSQQSPWLSLAVLGLIIGGCANVNWLLAARRRVGRRAHVFVAEHQPSAESKESQRIEPLAVAGHVVTVPSMTRFHSPSCILAQGKNASLHDKAELVALGKIPCKVCQL